MKIAFDMTGLSDQELSHIFLHLFVDDSGELGRTSPHVYLTILGNMMAEITARDQRTGIPSGTLDIPFDGSSSDDVEGQLEAAGKWCACFVAGLVNYPAPAELFQRLSIELGQAHRDFVAVVVGAESVIEGSEPRDLERITKVYTGQRRAFKRLHKRGEFG